MRLLAFFKREAVLTVAALCALATMVLVPPDAAYLGYIDLRVLCLLLCLMAVVAGFQSCGAFQWLAGHLLSRGTGPRALAVILVLLPFFCSMAVTNDVALITFAPFALLLLDQMDCRAAAVPLLVLQTIAANLGSMATPIGNPQNLYLYSVSDLTTAEFAWATLPYAGLSLLLLTAVIIAAKDEPLLEIVVTEPAESPKAGLLRSAIPFFGLLILCLLVVFRILPYQPVLVCVMAAVLLLKRKLYLSVDYFLLLTFLCFFVFIGNMKRIPEINALLVSAVQGRELLVGILASQIISNVPAAILLSGFSSDFSSLLTGVNLGGLGTLIASLASLISFKFFSREYPDKKGAFLKEFTIWNLVFLAILTAAALALGSVTG